MKLKDEQKKELAEVFKAEALEHLEIIEHHLSEMEALSGEEALRTFTEVLRKAHSIKGSSATLGFERVSKLAVALEKVLKAAAESNEGITGELGTILFDALLTIQNAVKECGKEEQTLSGNEEETVQILDAIANHFSETNKTKKSVETKPNKEKADKTAKNEQQISGAELPEDQLEYLAGIFKAEAIEHIKKLAEVFFALEDDESATGELVRAFREAHSLKGSAATLGFERVALVTHRLEDVLGILQRDQSLVSPDNIDLLLSALDVIRRAVNESALGDGTLTDEERNITESLEKLVSSTTTAQKGSAQQAAPQAPQAEEKSSSEERRTGKERRSAVPQEEPPKAPEGAATHETHETFIRVSEENIETVVAQVGELFEAYLKLKAATPEIKKYSGSLNEIVHSLESFVNQYGATQTGANAVPILEKTQNLAIRMGSMVKRFDEDERQFSKLLQNSQEGLRKIRLAPVSSIFVMLRRHVREVSKQTGKRITLNLQGGEYAVDRKVLEAIEDPLVHLIRNAVDHGFEDAEDRLATHKPEVGTLSVIARHTGDAVELSITDDGRGIDLSTIREALLRKGLVKPEEMDNLSRDQLLDYLFEPGFSTRSGVTNMSGRGVGLDVVKFTVERLGGEVRLESTPGKGSSISLRLPLAMSTLRCLLILVSGRLAAIPSSNVEKVILQKEDDTKIIGDTQVIEYRGQNIHVSSLADALGIVSPGVSDSSNTKLVIILSFGERRLAFQVDDIIEYTQVILRPLGDLLERVPNISGISLLGTGEMALVLNPADLVRVAGSRRTRAIVPKQVAEESKPKTLHILVVDDSIATRTLEKNLLESAGFIVSTATDGYNALQVLESELCDIVISDVQMPNMDGFELATAIKKRYGDQIPVVIISALGSNEDKAKGLEAGADAYIVKKELTQRELVSTIEQLV